jgi:hypothetical protein
MIVDYVVFDLATGQAVKAGGCQSELLAAQASEGQRALQSNSLTVDGNRAVIWGHVKTLRDAKINGGVLTPAGTFDSNDLSRLNVSGAVLGAVVAKSASAPYSVQWTLQDNSVVTLDADQMIEVGMAMLNHVAACHDYARMLRGMIEAATDMAELLAIDLEAGWPSTSSSEQ